MKTYDRAKLEKLLEVYGDFFTWLWEIHGMSLDDYRRAVKSGAWDTQYDLSILDDDDD